MHQKFQEELMASESDIQKALATLNVTEFDSWEVVRRAHKAMAFANHQTREGFNETKAQAVSWALAILKDAHLDQRRLPKPKPQAGPTGSPFHAFQHGATAGASQYRPNGRRPEAEPAPGPKTTKATTPSQKRGADIERLVSVSLLTAALGGEVIVKGSYRPVCGSCDGAGVSTTRTICGKCAGEGRSGEAAARGLCSQCRGVGTVFKQCDECKGDRKLPKRNYKYKVAVPAGTVSGRTLRLKGCGHESPGGTPGDMLLTAEVEAKPNISLLGNGDLWVSVPVSIMDWLAGGEVEIPTLEGSQMLAIGPQQMEAVLPQAGIPLRDGGRGCLRVRFSIELHGEMSSDGVELVRQARRHWKSVAGVANEATLKDWKLALRQHKTSASKQSGN